MRAGLKGGGGVGGGVGSGVEGGVGMQMGGRSRYRPGCNTNKTNISKYDFIDHLLTGNFQHLSVFRRNYGC
jgi:hypothetical protein